MRVPIEWIIENKRVKYQKNAKKLHLSSVWVVSRLGVLAYGLKCPYRVPKAPACSSAKSTSNPKIIRLTVS